MSKIKSVLQENINVMCTLLFAAFMLVQLVTLRFANQAGRGYLPTGTQVFVYLIIQIIVIAGFLLHALLCRLISVRVGYNNLTAAAVGLLAVGAVAMTFIPESSAVCLAVTGVTVLCLGVVGGAVYLKLSELIAGGARAGGCIGAAYSLAVALQYMFQLRWTFRYVLAILIIVSCAALAYIIRDDVTDIDLSKCCEENAAKRSQPIFSTVITLAMLVFTNFYNIYIHRMQIASGYTEYNVYSWPRLLMIPCMLMFGFIGDLRGAKFLSLSSLCIVVVAMLNAVLPLGETYLLCMCLYYIAFTSVIAYYNLTFLRITPRTKRPELWAVMGRLLDSLFVIITFIPGYSELPSAAVLTMDIIALCVIVLFMTLGGDLAVAESIAEKDAAVGQELTASGNDSSPVVQESMPDEYDSSPVGTTDEQKSAADDPLIIIEKEFGISPSELRVLRELILTDDKQEVIAARLNISVSTLRHHITSIYKKTGTKSRVALTKLTIKNNE